MYLSGQESSRIVPWVDVDSIVLNTIRPPNSPLSTPNISHPNTFRSRDFDTLLPPPAPVLRRQRDDASTAQTREFSNVFRSWSSRLNTP